MPYLLTHFWPGATEEQYRATLAAVHPGGALPPGQIYHAAADTGGGISIVAVWNSKGDSDRFVQETLMPAMPVEGGVTGHPDERGGDTVNVQTA
jgi:hypothetical protein